MTEKERELLEIIENNPQISQNEIADRLKITRSSVSVHINNLTKKGYIAGRRYVLNSSDYVCIIGSANIDILGFSSHALISEDSNPGHIQICLGGVGRNIAENLARLKIDVKLITNIGDDVYGKHLKDQCQLMGIDMSYAHVMSGFRSSIYMAIMSERGKMNLALSDMTTLDELPENVLQQNAMLIKRSRLIVVDTGLPKRILEYICANFNDHDLYLDPVSVGKAEHVKHLLSSFHTIKMNRLECEYLSDIKINEFTDLIKASEVFINKGVRRVFITLGEEGVFAREGEKTYQFKASAIKIVNETGAGDAFMAGIVYSSLQHANLEDCCEFSSAMAQLALASEDTVNSNMSLENVQRVLQEINTGDEK